jgi:hypothetical protein
MERECERPHRRSRTTDGYDVPDAYDATTPIFRRSTAAVSNVKCMTGSTAPGGCRCRLSVEGEGARPASDQPYLILKAGAPIDGDPRRRHARDPFTVRQGTTLMMITLMRTNRTAVGPARRRYSTIRGGGRGEERIGDLIRSGGVLKIVRGWRSLALRNLGSARDGLVSRGQKREQKNNVPHGVMDSVDQGPARPVVVAAQCAMFMSTVHVQCSCPM